MKQIHVWALSLFLVCTTGQNALALDQTLLDLPFDKKLQLAKAGDADARMALAEAYETGQGTKESAADAAKWYREAALTGNLDAQFRLAKLVRKGAPGLKIDKTAALALLLGAAKKGHAPSENLYGMMVQNGDGAAKDEKAAFEWYGKAADQGLAEAQNNLGVMLLLGKGTTRNLDEAFKMFSKAASNKDTFAMNNLGGMYEKGWAVPKDLDIAKKLYKSAAELGNETGKKNFERLDGPQATVAP